MSSGKKPTEKRLVKGENQSYTGHFPEKKANLHEEKNPLTQFSAKEYFHDTITADYYTAVDLMFLLNGMPVLALLAVLVLEKQPVNQILFYSSTPLGY